MEKITVAVEVAVPVSSAWEYFTDPVHIVKWNNTSADWHTPRQKMISGLAAGFSVAWSR